MAKLTPATACSDCQQFLDEMQETILQLGTRIETARKWITGEGIDALQTCVEEVRSAGDQLEDLLWQYSQHKKTHESKSEPAE